jgi:SAM-dependent methyltransferase
VTQLTTSPTTGLTRSEHAASERSHSAAKRSAEWPEHVARNRAAWERWAPRHISEGRRQWINDELRWGIWGVREEDINLLEDLPPGADVVEFGCGTASVSAWLARRSFKPVGVDFARPQLDAAERFKQEFGVQFPLVFGNAEELHYDRESFDCVISDYGASLWCDPERWVREAARLLRTGGRLVFLTNSTLLVTCTPDAGGSASSWLARDYFGRFRIEFPEDDAVEFHLTHGRWIRILRANGFVLDDLIETRPPGDAAPRPEFAAPDWADRWPTEDIWIATKVA